MEPPFFPSLHLMRTRSRNRLENIVLLDTETTGIEHRQDEIIELAALRAVPSEGQTETAEELDLLIRLSPGRTIPPFIQNLTGITDSMLQAEGVSKRDAAAAFSALLVHPNTLLVAYTAQFDLCFLYYFLARQKQANILQGVKLLDAMTVYKDRHDYPHKLCNAIETYGLQGQYTHRAIDDVKATLELLDAMATEEDDLAQYVNLFGYHPKYGVSGPRISSVTYRPQGYERHQKLYQSLP